METETLIKIPTGRRQTSWLFTKRGGVLVAGRRNVVVRKPSDVVFRSKSASALGLY